MILGVTEPLKRFIPRSFQSVWGQEFQNDSWKWRTTRFRRLFCRRRVSIFNKATALSWETKV
jgi:hypothetical protein